MKFNKVRTFKGLINNLFMSAKAEEKAENLEPTKVESPQQQEPPQPKGTVDFETLIAQARKEEKNKLYPQIEETKKKLNNALLVIGERDATIADLQEQLAKEKSNSDKYKKKAEEGTSTNETVQQLSVDKSKLENDYVKLQQEFDAYKAQVEVDKVRTQLIAEAKGNIIPELVTGNTEEEILASVEVAKNRFVEIQQQALQGVKMPSVNPAQKQMQVFSEKTTQEIASMTNSEYAEYRKALGLK